MLIKGSPTCSRFLWHLEFSLSFLFVFVTFPVHMESTTHASCTLRYGGWPKLK